LYFLNFSVHNLRAHRINQNYVLWTSSRRSDGRGILGFWRRNGDRIWSIKKPLVGSEYIMAYFMLHFIPGGRQIISQSICNESAKISVLFLVCVGSCRCWWSQ